MNRECYFDLCGSSIFIFQFPELTSNIWEVPGFSKRGRALVRFCEEAEIPQCHLAELVIPSAKSHWAILLSCRVDGAVQLSGSRSMTSSWSVLRISFTANDFTMGIARYGDPRTGHITLKVHLLRCFADFIRIRYPSDMFSNLNGCCRSTLNEL